MIRLAYLPGLALMVGLISLCACNKPAKVAPIYNGRSSVMLITNGDTVNFTSTLSQIQYSYKSGSLNSVILNFADSLGQNIFSWVGSVDTTLNATQTGVLSTITGGNLWTIQNIPFYVSNFGLTYAFTVDSANIALSGTFSGQVVGTNYNGQTVRCAITNSTFTGVPVLRSFF